MSNFQLHVLEAKDFGEDKPWETTAWIFHDISEAKDGAKELLLDKTFEEVRVRTYYPNLNDTGEEIFAILGDKE